MPQQRKHDTNAARQRAYRSRREKARQIALAAKGLPPLPAIAALPGWKRWNASFAGAQQLVQTALDEMQSYFDERSETWQESERGDEHQERMSVVEQALDALTGLDF